MRIFAGIMLLLAAAAWPQQRQGASAMSFTLSSTAFSPGGEIPSKYTCSGADVSPVLNWNDPPAGTQSFALIADDPDAPVGTWVHWVAYDLPASARQLPEAVAKTEAIAGGGVQGQNDFRKTGYGGPCPPPGKPHRYYFKLHALDRKLNLKPGATKKVVEPAMEGHILTQAEVMGRFQR
ncbi:MAG: YbhB/YbcL family Raf kinase inhibitor-like protein [Terriglobales bacterium]